MQKPVSIRLNSQYCVIPNGVEGTNAYRTHTKTKRNLSLTRSKFHRGTNKFLRQAQNDAKIKIKL